MAIVVALILLLALLQLAAPVGYVGGGADDWYYVDAARCMATHGYCPPTTHWGTRLPVIAPLAASFALLGDTVVTAAIVPFLYATLCIVLLSLLVFRHLGARTASFAGLVFTGCGAFAGMALQPGADIPELAWLLLAATCALRADTRRGLWWCAAAGLALGVAVLARPTALVWVPMTIVVAVVRPTLARHILVLMGAVALALVGDALVHAAHGASPMLTWTRALGHGRIWSSELAANIDTSASPLLNPVFIGGWRPSAGLPLHWTVQGPLNLLVGLPLGPLFLGCLALWSVARLDRRERRAAWLLATLAAGHIAVLTYVLAVDPKPRMFLPAAALLAVVLAISMNRLWHDRRRLLPSAVAVLIVASGALLTADRPRFGPALAVLDRWAIADARRAVVDEATYRFAAFVPAVAALPLGPTVGRDRLLTLSMRPCASAVTATRTLVRAAPVLTTGETLYVCAFTLIPSDRAQAPHP